jgi:hypothetical protein
VGADGNVDASCAAKCPEPTGSAGQQAVATLNACWTGSAASCSACGSAKADAGLIPLLQETCPPAQDTDTCVRCDHEKCCTVDDACTKNPECVAVINCLPDTATYGDVATCMMMHPGGALAFTQRFACRQVLCTTTSACPTATKPLPCDACYLAHCPDSFAELVGTEDGFDLYYTCYGGPCAMIQNDVKQFEACLAMCRTMYPSAATAFDDFLLCESTRCPTDC